MEGKYRIRNFEWKSISESDISWKRRGRSFEFTIFIEFFWVSMVLPNSQIKSIGTYKNKPVGVSTTDDFLQHYIWLSQTGDGIIAISYRVFRRFHLFKIVNQIFQIPMFQSIPKQHCIYEWLIVCRTFVEKLSCLLNCLKVAEIQITTQSAHK